MLSLSKTLDEAMSIGAATARLTDTILGNDHRELAETLQAIASEIGISHIAYLRLSPDKSTDGCSLVSAVTYSILWQQRYFLKKYLLHDPVVSYGRNTDQPFDWANLPIDDPSTKAFSDRRIEPQCGPKRPLGALPWSPGRILGGFIHQRRVKGRMGGLQSRQYEEP